MFGRGRLGQASDDSDPEMDLSPMIDCVFILLIFFIVTAVFVEEDGQQFNRPEDSAAASAMENKTVLFLLSASNTITYEGRTIGVDAVQGIVTARMGLDDEARITIQSHPDSAHGMRASIHDQVKSAGAGDEIITMTTG